MNINFLIRTSNRPETFKRCLDSILRDDYEDINVNFIIGYDNEEALKYVSLTEFYHAIQIQYTGDRIACPFFYNSYINAMMNSEKIIPGHINIIDDDDEWRAGSFEVLRKFLKPNQSFIFPFLRKNDYQKPTPAMMFAHRIHRGYIGFQSLVLSTEHRHLIKFDDTEDSDYNGIKMLSEKTPLKWVNKPLILVSDRARGKMEK